MKKPLFNFLAAMSIVIMTCCVTYSQKCKYQTNEMDKFTGKHLKVTKAEKVIGTFYTAGTFSVKKVDTTFFFIFDYALSSYSNFDPYSISEGAKLLFLLDNGDIITTTTLDKIAGTMKTMLGLPPVYSCNLSNVAYHVNKKQIEKMFASKIKSIRFYRNESNGKEDFVDNEIKHKNSDDILNLIKCVL